MEDFFVQECCVHGTDLENHGPTSILCDDPLPIESSVQATPSMLTTRGTTTAAATAPPSRASPGPPPAGTAGRWPSENGLRLKLKSIKYFLLFLRKNI